MRHGVRVSQCAGRNRPPPPGTRPVGRTWASTRESTGAVELDFSDPRRQAALERAAKLISEAYEILCDEVGSPNPSDNAFLREAMVCAKVGLVWVGDRGGIDARDPRTGDEVEIKSTKLTQGRALNFPTSRAISPPVIERFRAAGYWLFAVFDDFSNLIALYRVPSSTMSPKIDDLERKMMRRAAAGEPLENNPKTSLDSIRSGSELLLLSDQYEELQISPGRWRIGAC